MDFLYDCIAGVLATFIMTLFMLLSSRVTGFNLRVPSILGSLLTMETKPSGASSRSINTLFWGNLVHYAIGILFALGYQQMLLLGDGVSTFATAITYGAIAGIFAVIWWFTFLKLHPMAPAVNLKVYLLCIFIAHLLFGLGLHLGFLLLAFFFNLS